MSFSPLETDILTLQKAMESGEITSEELTRYYLERINAYDQAGPKLNAIIAVNPNALADARRLDEERTTAGKRTSLHGIPVVVKDNFNTYDVPTTAGSVLLAENRPASDAFILNMLRMAGAVILAKTNLSEFACHGWTEGTLTGQTLNPYDLTRTPGGSSGGTGAAVAANFAVAGLGTDTANSVRSPASATNLVGFRPTTGLFSRGGILPVSKTQDSPGTLTRSVADAAVLFHYLIGYDPADPVTAEQVGKIPPSYWNSLTKDGLRGKRLGLLTNNSVCAPEVQTVLDAAIQLLRENGAEVIPVDIPELESGTIGDACDVQYYEFKEQLDLYFANAVNCPISSFQALVDSGRLFPGIAEFMADCAKVEDPETIQGYKDNLLAIQRSRLTAFNAMVKHRLDAFVYPHQKILVEMVGAKSQAGRNGIVASLLAFPAVTVPAGFSEPTADAPIGVPVGIEFMARPWSEPQLFEIAYAFEQVSKSRRLPPATP